MHHPRGIRSGPSDPLAGPRRAALDRKVPTRTRVAFSTGAFEEAAIGAAGIATMVFYNQVLGVDPWLCGMVFFVASVVDAVSDPLVGSLTDNFRSRWGRRHPFMLLAILPLALAFYLMYAPPADLSELQYFWWFLGTMVLLRLGKTFYAIPHDALGAELTDDYHERTSVFGYNSVAGLAASAVLGVVVLVAVFPSTSEHENGLLNPDQYPVLALFGAAWIAVTLLICVIGTRNQIPNLHRTNRERVRVAAYLRDLFVLVKSRSYISVPNRPWNTARKMIATMSVENESWMSATRMRKLSSRPPK